MNFENVEWAGWMEETVRLLLRERPECIAMQAALPSGEIMTGYYECGAQDKHLFAAAVTTDAVWDSIEANADRLREILEEDD